jgi:hypothetical protein
MRCVRCQELVRHGSLRRRWFIHYDVGQPQWDVHGDSHCQVSNPEPRHHSDRDRAVGEEKSAESSAFASTNLAPAIQNNFAT